MKKLLLIGFCVLMSIGVYAQKGEKAIGVNLNFGTAASNVGLGVKFQYGITDAIRIEPTVNYYFGNSSILDIGANAHYLFEVAPKIKVYPLVGLGLAMCRYEVVDMEDVHNKIEDILTSNPLDLMTSGTPEVETKHKTDVCFMANFGGGVEYAINDKFSVGLELKYAIIPGGFSQFVVGIGSTYKF